MRIRRTASFVIAAATLLAASGSHADDFFRKGYYLNMSAAYGFNQMDTATFVQNTGIPSPPFERSDSWGLNVRAGFQTESWLAFEIEYEWMQGLELSLPAGSAPIVNGQLSVYSMTYNPDVITVNAKFALPIWRVQPYLLVGAGFVTYEILVSPPYPSLSRSDQGFAFRGGAGVDFFLTRHIAINAEATYLMNTDTFEVYTVPAIENLNYISVSAGFTYHF